MAEEEGHKSKDPQLPEQQKLVESYKSREGYLTNGLTSAEVATLQQQFGPNELQEKVKPQWLVFLSFFWGPMPCMIWVAIIIELVQAILTDQGYEDLGVLLFLQCANALVGFIEQHNAGNAVAELKSQLAPKCYVMRDGKWASLMAKDLVPGDLIELKLGDVVPADSILLDGMELQVDQAALTGESLPVMKGPGGKVLMSSAIKKGETKAVIVATGKNTFFGNAASMISSVETHGHLQKVLTQITFVLCIVSIVSCLAILWRLLAYPYNPQQYNNGINGVFLQALSTVVVILVASIPVAIEIVCTSTLAVGSHAMSAHKVIVSRLSAIEELAGMTILCSDKTGTLTLNQLSLRDPIIFAEGMSSEEVVFLSSLSSKREKGNQDAIDLCITGALTPENVARMEEYKETNFMPFNPTDKRTEATVTCPDGTSMKVTKGAPQVVLKLAHNAAELKGRVDAAVQELADRGFRALGVAVSKKDGVWEYIAILSLFDPPRHDTKATIAAAIDNGVEVKMVTGDQTAIAKETCRQLGMGDNILNTSVLNDPNTPKELIDRIILEAHGFAEVMPEHKFQVVQALRELGHVTGMTGDGVNDAPALKRADIGVAVHGATDAARAAADLILTEPGLSVIIDAIFESRKIFQRMRNYIIYRISATMQTVLFFFFIIICANLDTSYFYNGDYPPNNLGATNWTYPNSHEQSFSLPVLSLVLMTLLNDGCMITISHDRVVPEKQPQKWAMQEIWVVGLIMGSVAGLSALILTTALCHSGPNNPWTFVGQAWGATNTPYVTFFESRTAVYLQISVTGIMILLSARTVGFFWTRPIGVALAVAMSISAAVAILFSLFWDEMFPVANSVMMGLRNSPGAVISTLVYSVLWWFAMDICKVLTYKYIIPKMRSEREQHVLSHAQAHSLEGLVSRMKEGTSGFMHRIGDQLSFHKPTAVPIAELPKAEAELQPQGTIGRARATVGRLANSLTYTGQTTTGSTRRHALDYLPAGVDLTAIVTAATQETVRLNAARAAQQTTVADLASGAAAARAAAAQAPAASSEEVSVSVTEGTKA